MNRKKSKVWRKDLNQLRGMGDVPWPAREHRVAATSGRPLLTNRRCARLIGLQQRPRSLRRRVVDFVLRRRPEVLAGVKGLLTPRQIEVLGQAARGLSITESAEETHHTPATVKFLRSQILMRLDARNITHAVAIGFHRGLLEIG